MADTDFMATAKRTSSRPTRNPEETRNRLIDAFIELSSEFGAASVTLQKTAARAKVPFATAHYHFGGDFMALQLAALDQVGKRAQVYVDAELDRPAKSSHDKNPLERYVRSNFRWAREYPKSASAWLYLYYLLSLSEKHRPAHFDFLEVARARIKKLIFESIGMEFYAAQTVQANLVIRLHDCLVGGFVLALTDPDKGAGEKHEDLTWLTIDSLLKKA